MVNFEEITASNSRIKAELPAELVAVFPGATNGIGEASLKQFAKYVAKPRVYFIGRSQEAGDRIAQECSKINPQGQYTFIKADLGLVKNVDKVCNEIKAKESFINLLLMSIGSFAFTTKTEEGLRVPAALTHYSRARFMQLLLPLLRKATSLRRVVTVFAGTKEGPVNNSDWAMSSMYQNPMKGRGHAASMVTMTLETLRDADPGARDVSFVHSFPGFVKTGISREAPAIMSVLGSIFSTFRPKPNYIDNADSGDFHVYLATSATYPPAEQREGDAAVGVPQSAGAMSGPCRGTDGQLGSGVYAVQERGDTDASSVQTLRELRAAKMPEALWAHTQQEFVRILGDDAKPT